MIGLTSAAAVAALAEIISQLHFHSHDFPWRAADVVALVNDLLVYGIIALGSVIVAVRASRRGLLVWGAGLILGAMALTQGIFFPSGIGYYLSDRPRSGWALVTPLADLLLVAVAVVALILVLGRRVRAHFQRAAWSPPPVG